MKKIFNQFIETIVENFSKLCKISFPILRILISLLNGLIAVSGIAILLITIFLYIIPPLHIFIDSLKHIFNVHSVFGTMMIVALVVITISISGLYCLYKHDYEKLGLQGASFLVLLIVMIALIFTFWVEWEANAHFGMSYATHSYSPKMKDSRYLESIQKFLSCCGSRGPKDFDIANEYFFKGMVPISCCNTKKNFEICSKLAKQTKYLAINSNYSFQVGCMTKLEKIVWPSIVMVILNLSILSFICMIITSFVCVIYDSYIKNGSEIGNNNLVVLSEVIENNNNNNNNDTPKIICQDLID